MTADDCVFSTQLWPIFSRAFHSLLGYKPEHWRFEQGVTPMSTMPQTAAALISYYLIIFGGREIMKDRAALKLNGLFKVHNLYLTIISGVLLVLFLEQLIPTVVRHGIFYAVCDYDGGWTPQLVILYYVCFLPPPPSTLSPPHCSTHPADVPPS